MQNQFVKSCWNWPALRTHECELFTCQLPQKLNILREHALIERERSISFYQVFRDLCKTSPFAQLLRQAPVPSAGATG